MSTRKAQSFKLNRLALECMKVMLWIMELSDHGADSPHERVADRRLNATRERGRCQGGRLLKLNSQRGLSVISKVGHGWL